MKDILEFEQINSMSISVYGIDDGDKMYPLNICSEELSCHRDLLYLTNDNRSLYCYI
jgi:hypothetical protein